MSLIINSNWCIGCEWCKLECPTGAINVIHGYVNNVYTNSFVYIDGDACIECGACAIVCPTQAIVDENGNPFLTGGGGDEGGGGGGESQTNVGENRFKMKLVDQQKYPRFTNMVKDLHSFVKNDIKVLDALKKWSGFSETEILEKVKFGQGPEIVIKELNNSDHYGYFDESEDPNIVNINASWARGLEQANLVETQQATGFILAVTILHEFVHLGRNANSLDQNTWEYGYGFEQSAFGTYITKNNAGKYAYRFYKK